MKDLDLHDQLTSGMRFFILIVINVIVISGANYVLSTKLTPSLYAGYAFLIANANLLAILLTMGYDLSANKYLSKYLIDNESSLARGFMNMTRIKIIKAAIICILITIIYWFIEPIIEKTYQIEMPEEEMAVWFNIAILFGILNIFTVIMRCLGRTELGFLLGIFLPSLLILIIAILIPEGLHTFKHFNQIMLYIFLAYMIPVLIGVITTHILFKKEVRHSAASNYTNKLDWSKSSKIMMFYAFIAAAGNVIPINVLELYSGGSVSKDQIGAFALAFNIVYTIFTIPLLTTKGTIMAVLYPLYSKGDHKSLQTIILYSNRLSLAFNLTIVLLFIAFNSYISNLISAGYNGFIAVFLLLCAGFAIDLSLNTTRTSLLMLGSERKVLFNRLVTVTLQLILSLIIGYHYGMYGVCIVIIITRNLAAIQMMLELKKLGYKSL